MNNTTDEVDNVKHGNKKHYEKWHHATPKEVKIMKGNVAAATPHKSGIKAIDDVDALQAYREANTEAAYRRMLAELGIKRLA